LIEVPEDPKVEIEDIDEQPNENDDKATKKKKLN